MIEREYESLKFKRTYSGGSKKKEFEIFKQVQNAGGNCDWIAYKRILFPYFEDVIHVTFSHAYIAKILSVVFIAFSLSLVLHHLVILSIITLLLSTFSRILFIIFERKTKQALMSYKLSYTVVKNEVKKTTGLEI